MVIMASGIARGRVTQDGDDDGVTQHGGHTPNNGLIETCSLDLLFKFTSLILDIHVMIN